MAQALRSSITSMGGISGGRGARSGRRTSQARSWCRSWSPRPSTTGRRCWIAGIRGWRPLPVWRTNMRDNSHGMDDNRAAATLEAAVMQVDVDDWIQWKGEHTDLYGHVP